MLGEIKFLTKESVQCRITNHFLSRRTETLYQYPLNKGAIRERIQSILKNEIADFENKELNIVEIHTNERMCSAISKNYILLDYGFIELLIDNIAFEYLSNKLYFCIFDEKQLEQNDEIEITGSMITRDIDCKFIESIVPNKIHQTRLIQTILWPIDEEIDEEIDELELADDFINPRQRPTLLHYERLVNEKVNMLDMLLKEDAPFATLEDLTEILSLFIASHELSHLKTPEVNVASWKKTKVGSFIGDILPELFKWEMPSLLESNKTIPLNEIVGFLTQQTQNPQVKTIIERAEKEAIIDMDAIDLILSNRLRNTNSFELDEWSQFVATLLTMAFLSNALLIFRYHTESSIRKKDLETLDIYLARAEAVLRNLMIFSYVIHRNSLILPPEQASYFVKFIHPEIFTLERRTLFFQLDIIAPIGRESWADFIDLAFS